MPRTPSRFRLVAAAFALLMSGSVALPAVASVYMGLVCCLDEVEAPVSSPMPCHEEAENEPHDPHGSTAMICCPTDNPVVATLILPGSKELRTSLVAVEHAALVVETRPIQVTGRHLLEQIPRGIPGIGLSVLHASLLI